MTLSREQIIRLMYRGGQAAIGAELLAVLGIVVLALIDADLVMTNLSNFEVRQQFLMLAYEQPLATTIASLLIGVAPAAAMLVVIWVWHLYLHYEGVRLMHLIATTVGLTGFVLRILYAGLDVVLLQDVAQVVATGQITYLEAYGSLSVITASYTISSAALYGAYPMMLVVATWQKRLLPTWFIIPAFVFSILNDINLLYGAKSDLIFIMANVALVLFPFLIGTVMLQKAQKLATDLYTEIHGTPPPTTAPGRPRTPPTT